MERADRTSWLAFGLTVLCALVVAAPAAWGQTIRASTEPEGTIRVLVPGRFETTFTRRKGFGATLHDLKHDRQKRQDLAPVAEENGLLWTKTRGGSLTGDGSWYANPPEKIELLESGPARVRVRVSGWHRKYGRTRPGDVWKELGFEQTFTMYASGHVYVDYALVAEKPVANVHHFLLIIKSTGAWGKQGKGAAKRQAHCAGLHGPKRPAPWSKTLTPFALQWSDGPTCFLDILMVMYKGLYSGSYWDEGYREKDYRAGLRLAGRWKDKTIPAGRSHIHLLMRFGDDMNSPAAAKPYADDYRTPDKPTVLAGKLDVSDDGDRDGDGFNEAEGCYVLTAAKKPVALLLHGAKTPRMQPAFKTKSWPGAAPSTLSLNGKSLLAGRDFNASVREGTLLVQIMKAVKTDAKILIGG